MNAAKKRPEENRPEPQIQQGDDRSKARDDELKRVVRQHPQRDEPRVDSAEEEPPPPPGSRRH